MSCFQGRYSGQRRLEGCDDEHANFEVSKTGHFALRLGAAEDAITGAFVTVFDKEIGVQQDGAIRFDGIGLSSVLVQITEDGLNLAVSAPGTACPSSLAAIGSVQLFRLVRVDAELNDGVSSGCNPAALTMREIQSDVESCSRASGPTITSDLTDLPMASQGQSPSNVSEDDSLSKSYSASLTLVPEHMATAATVVEGELASNSALETDDFSFSGNEGYLQDASARRRSLLLPNDQSLPIDWVHCGWMHKQGHVVKNWKKRFCVVTGSSLKYFESDLTAHSRGKPKGLITLQSGSVRWLGDSYKKKRGCFFEVQDGNSGKVTVFDCTSLQDAQIWLDLLGAVVSHPVIDLNGSEMGPSAFHQLTSDDDAGESGSAGTPDNAAKQLIERLRILSRNLQNNLSLASNRSEDTNSFSKGVLMQLDACIRSAQAHLSRCHSRQLQDALVQAQSIARTASSKLQS